MIHLTMGQLLICMRVAIELFIKKVLKMAKLSLTLIIFVACLPATQGTKSCICDFMIS